jgi:hypothetical protein
MPRARRLCQAATASDSIPRRPPLRRFVSAPGITVAVAISPLAPSKGTSHARGANTWMMRGLRRARTLRRQSPSFQEQCGLDNRTTVRQGSLGGV